MSTPTANFHNIKRLHVVFAIASLAMLAVTVWMVVADHRREWKGYQRAFRDEVEPWLTEAQLQEERLGDFRAREQELVERLAKARAAMPARQLVDRFEQTVRDDASRQGLSAPDFASLDAAYDALAAQPGDQTRAALLASLQTFLDAARLRQGNVERQLRFRRAEFDEARSGYEAAVGEQLAPARLEQLRDQSRRRRRAIEPWAARAEDASAHAESLVRILSEIGGDEESARRQLADHRAAADRLDRALAQQRPSTAKELLRLPLIDAFARPLSVEQIWLPDLPINYNFRQVARFDRCTTCHQGIAKTSPGLLASPAECGEAVEIRRGLPQPYRSHARLDLFVGSTSPHPANTFGCTICHEGQGSATQFSWASHAPNEPTDRLRWRQQHGWFWNPDWGFPMRPQRLIESSCLRCHPQVTDLAPSARFPDAPAAKLLAGYHLVRQNGCFGCHEIKGVTDSGAQTGPDMRLEPPYQEVASPSLARPGLAPEHRVPGTMRKVGPSLRNAARKLDARFVASWLRQPADFRPDTRMPQFFGLHEHLSGQSLDDARRFEAVEIRALADYVLQTQPAAQAIPPPSEVTESPSVERGKRLFRMQGCLACHKHSDSPEGQSTIGPDLSRIGAKLNTPTGKRWLVDWIRDPSRHSPRTVMPNSQLAPAPLAAQENSDKPAEPAGNARVRITDPAADIAAYLATSAGWQAKDAPALIDSDLDELALLYLATAFPRRQAERYLREGFPQSMVDQVQGETRELLGPIDRQKKLRYVARRTIRKRGCSGCHDIPGFEDAQPIGPALSDWGCKQASLLAFEQIDRFVAAGEQAAGGAPPTAKPEDEARRGFFSEALLAHRREGFLWQKLHAPRSFDYQKTENKGYNEHLLMGRFALSDAEIEAIITFILGLVAEPPPEKYVHQPGPRAKAIAAGRKVLDQYACAQCHTLEMERWTLRFDPASFPSPREIADYPFLKPEVAPADFTASLKTDRYGRRRAEVVGMPRVDPKGRLLEEESDDGNPLYFFDLWERAVINGTLWPVGGAQVAISKSQRVGVREPVGGALARLLYPLALAEAKASGATAAEAEAWGWVPPPLTREGSTVEPAWLHDYLLAPFPIRPAAVLRMPKYNLSALEAGKLVDYFAAASAADFPYSSHPSSRDARQSAVQGPGAERLAGAMRILTDRKTFCAKCHLIGDFSPGGEIRTTLAPNLENVGRRIRPEYLRRWLANPKSIRPYTAMPVNFPPTGEPLGQDLFRASSIEQLDAMVDLLLNYDWYLNRRASVRKMIESAEKKDTPAATGER